MPLDDDVERARLVGEARLDERAFVERRERRVRRSHRRLLDCCGRRPGARDRPRQ